MKVVYKKWQDGEGLEEIQAQIYTEVAGIPAQAWQIRPRNNQRGEEATRYVLTEDGKPLAYVTSNTDLSEPGRALVGYPWSMPDCPSEAKEKIFDEQLAHVENTEGITEIITGIVLASKVRKEQIEWFKARGFEELESYYRYVANLDVKEASKRNVEGKAAKLSSRVATDEDLDILVELCLNDENLRYAFPDKAGFETYFKERVFPAQKPVLLFDGDDLVAASAPLRFEGDGTIAIGEGEVIIMRFAATKAGYEYALERLIIEIAKLSESLGWTDIPLQTGFGFSSDRTQTRAISRIIPDVQEFEIFMIKRLDKK